MIQEERQEAEAWLKDDLQCEFICESTKNANNLLTQAFLAYADQDKLDAIGKKPSAAWRK